MAALTTKEYIREIDKRLNKIDKTVGLCISGTTAKQSLRIFVSGQRSGGGKIGQYQNARYKELRSKKGRQTGFVDLRFTSLLKADFETSLTRSDKSTWIVGIKSQFNTEKYNNLLELYGEDVWLLSRSERQQLNKCITDERAKLKV